MIDVHELVTQITELLGVTPDDETAWDLRDLLGRFAEAAVAAEHEALEEKRADIEDDCEELEAKLERLQEECEDLEAEVKELEAEAAR